MLSKLDNEEDLLAVIMDQLSTSVNISSSALFPAPSFPVYQPSSVSSVPPPSISMGAYSVNLMVPEGTDTEKVADISVTVITETNSSCRRSSGVEPLRMQIVSQAERMVKRSRVDFKPGKLRTTLLCLFH